MMKKVLGLAVSTVLGLSACAAAGPTATPVTYESVKTAYQSALAAESYDAQQLPHVTPAVFELLHGTYHQPQQVIAEEVDLDGDGTKELLLGYQLDTGVETSGFYISVFTEKEGQVYDLFAPHLPEQGAYFMLVYRENLIQIDRIEDNLKTHYFYQIQDGEAQEIERFTPVLTAAGGLEYTDKSGQTYSQLGILGQFEALVKDKTPLPEVKDATPVLIR